MKKRIASLLMAIVMLASLGIGSLAATSEKTLVQGNTTGLSAANFKDLADATKADGRHWAWNEIDHVVKYGLFNGTSATTFAPQNGMTRAQFVVVITRLENSSRSAKDKLNVERVPTETRFTDVPTDMWCAGAVAWAEKNGIVEGYSDNTFKPNQVISRAQIAAFVYRYVNNYRKYKLKELKPVPDQFTDFADVHQVFQTAVNYCRTHDLIRGYGDHSLRPNIAVTRAQVAAILSRIVLIIESSSRSGGGGGGNWNPAPAPTALGFTLNPNKFGSWEAGNYTVKFVAVAQNSQPDENIGGAGKASALLYAYEKPATDAASITLESEQIGNTDQAGGFKLDIQQLEGYNVINVDVYTEELLETTVADAENPLADTAYSYDAGTTAVTMTQEQFNANKRVTVVARYQSADEAVSTAKTEPTNFRFIALDENGDENKELGKAVLMDWNTVKNTTTKNGDLKPDGSNSLPQGKDAETGLLVGAKIAITANSGYEIVTTASDEPDITVYDTSGDQEVKLDSSKYTLSGYDVNMTAAALGSSNDDMIKEVTVKAKFKKSEYGYRIQFDLPIPVMANFGFNLDTYKSYKDGEKAALKAVGGGQPIKDALALLLDDSPLGSAPLNSDQVADKDSNTEHFDAKIYTAMSQMIIGKLNDGIPMPLEDSGKLASSVESMATSTGAGIVNAQLSKGDHDAKIIDKVGGTLKSGLEKFYTEMFQGYAKAINDAAPANVTLVTADKFVDASGSDVEKSLWSNGVKAENFEFIGKLTADNLSLNQAGMTTEVTLKRKESNTIEVKPDIKNATISLNSITGDFTLTIKDAGVLYVPVTMGSNQAVKKTVVKQDDYTITYDPAGTGTVTVKGSVSKVPVTGIAPVPVTVEGLDSSVMKGIVQQILDETVQGKIESSKQSLKKALKGKASDKVLSSLDRNMLNRLDMYNYLKVDDSGNIVFNRDLLANGSGKEYRAIIMDLYNGFWDFNADLYNLVSDASTRANILFEVLNWLRGKVISSNSGRDQLTLMAKALTKKQVPTVESFYTAMGGTDTKNVDAGHARTISTKGGMKAVFMQAIGFNKDSITIDPSFKMAKIKITD